MNTMNYQTIKEIKWILTMILKKLTDLEESVDLSDMSLLDEDEEEVKEGKGLKILTGTKLLSRLPVLLA